MTGGREAITLGRKASAWGRIGRFSADCQGGVMMRARAWKTWFAGALGWGVASLLLATPAHADDFLVTNPADGGPGSLRALVAEANSRPGLDTITIPAGMTVLLEDTILIEEDLNIVGASQGSSVIGTADQGDAAWEMFRASHENLSLSDVTLDGGDRMASAYYGDGAEGAGMTWERVTVQNFNGGVAFEQYYGTSASLAFIDVTWSRVGMGVFLRQLFPGATFTMSGNTFRDTTGYAINMDRILADQPGTVSIKNTEVSGASQVESAPVRLGGVGRTAEFSGPIATLDGLYLHENAAGTESAALQLDFLNSDGLGGERLVEIRNSTLVGSPEDTDQPLVETGPDGGSVLILNSTLQAGSGQVALHNSSAAENATVVELDHVTAIGPIESAGPVLTNRSLIQTEQGLPFPNTDTPEMLSGQDTLTTVEQPGFPGARVVAFGDVKLGELAGGAFAGAAWTVPVRVPQPDSALLDAAATPGSDRDQRGLPRPSGGNSDVGAVEVQQATISVGNAEPVLGGTKATFPISVVSPGEHPVEVSLRTEDGTALAGRDYTQTAETFTWQPEKQGSAQMSVPTLAAEGQDGRTFALTVQKITGGQADPDRGTGELRVEEETVTPEPTPSPTETTPPPTQTTTPPPTSMGPDGSSAGTANGHRPDSSGLAQTGAPAIGSGAIAAIILLGGGAAVLALRTAQRRHSDR